jgi:tyrosine decarboxylase / aspartate 1-decarboxylase
MTSVWTTKSREEIKLSVFNALEKNVNYNDQGVLGIPASYLDQKVFNQDAAFLKDAPFMSAMVKNPNHIGCHTLGSSEQFFGGTQAIEQELIEICAVDILKGEPKEQDGYVASGGTEANIQAIWVYRNFFKNQCVANNEQIVILCSQDSHYSMDKAANLLNLDIIKIAVHPNNRELDAQDLNTKIEAAKLSGKRYFITIANMMTTMFGSVDDVDLLTSTLKAHELEFKLHVDGAYGGFYFPFSQEHSRLTFQNRDISSFTLDAHKMAQAPYGTGIFLIRKGLIKHANTKEASYVEGEDFTLIGSRSGANAVAVWMILSTYGPHGWFEKILVLQRRTDWLCNELTKLGVEFYRNPHANIVTIKCEFLDNEIAKKFGLVPDNHRAPNWFKVVVMDHVSLDKLAELVKEMEVFAIEKCLSFN